MRQIHKSELVNALANIEPCAIRVKGWCRIVDYRYSTTPLSAAGTRKRGGRFNIGGDCDRTSAKPFPALYIAEDHKTAMLERFGESETSTLSAPELALRTDTSYSYVRLDGRLDRVLKLNRPRDFRDFTKVIKDFRLPEDIEALGDRLGYESPHVVERASVLLTTLLAKDWRYLPANHGLPANPQIFAALARDAGFQAISYKSVRGGNYCVALFPDKLDRSDSWVGLADAAPESVAITELNKDTWPRLV